MTLLPASRLGQYEIVSAIGAGGMGEVYRARDTQLNRHVAIKVLPELFAADAERLARFTREAQTLAALNHPNIAQIYGLQEGPAKAGPYRTALVMELVDGDDLSVLIARGPTADCRGAADRTADRRRTRSRARQRDHPSRSQAGEREGAARWHRQGPRLRARQGDDPR